MQRCSSQGYKNFSSTYIQNQSGNLLYRTFTTLKYILNYIVSYNTTYPGIHKLKQCVNMVDDRLKSVFR